MDSKIFKKMEEDLEFFNNLEREDYESMADFQKLTERVEKLEKEVEKLNMLEELQDALDKSLIEQLGHLGYCVKKQKEWNDKMQEKTDLLNKIIELKTGGQK